MPAEPRRERRSRARAEAARRGRASQPAPTRLELRLGVLVGLIGVLLYLNTLGHHYARDDQVLIVQNAITRRGWEGVAQAFLTSYRAGTIGPADVLYRPLPKAMFAAEWALAPGRPALGHAVNVLLYGLTGLALFAMLRRYVRGQWLLAFAAAVLFMVHPIHTEVVANIKGRDEILCLLTFAVSALAARRFAERGHWPSLALGAAALFLSMLAKESAVTFVVVIPLMLFFFTDTPRSRMVSSALALLGASAVYLIVRHAVMGAVAVPPTEMIDNYLTAIADTATREATAVYLMGVYLARLVVPHPLLSDGSYRHFPVVTMSDWRFLLPLGVGLALIAYAAVRARARDALSFAILYFFVTASVASNVVVLIGTNYGERLMYIPSLGFCLALAVLLGRVAGTDAADEPRTLVAFARAHRRPLAALGVLAALGGVLTVIRNADWYDDVTLFTRDLRHAPGSARLHGALGHELLANADSLLARGEGDEAKRLATRAITHLNRAVEIHPKFDLALGDIGLAYQVLDDTVRARQAFEEAMRIEPSHALVHNNFGTLLLKVGDTAGAIEHYRHAVRASPDYADAHLNLGLALARAAEQSTRAAAEGRQRLGERGYQDQMRATRDGLQAAAFHLRRALDLEPGDFEAAFALGITYRMLNDEGAARDYLERAERLKRRAGGRS